MSYAVELTLKCYYPNITITYRVINSVEEALLLLSNGKDTNVLEDKRISLWSKCNYIPMSLPIEDIVNILTRNDEKDVNWIS